MKTKIEMTISFQRDCIDKMTWVCCLNCENYDKENRICKLVNETPPDLVLISGCKSHVLEIPF